MDFAQIGLLHRKIGAVTNLGTSKAGHYVLVVAAFAKEEKVVCAAGTRGQLALPGVTFGNSSEAKCWFTAPSTFHACEKAHLTENLSGPGETDVRLIGKKLHASEAHA